MPFFRELTYKAVAWVRSYGLTAYPVSTQPESGIELPRVAGTFRNWLVNGNVALVEEVDIDAKTASILRDGVLLTKGNGEQTRVAVAMVVVTELPKVEIRKTYKELVLWCRKRELDTIHNAKIKFV